MTDIGMEYAIPTSNSEIVTPDINEEIQAARTILQSSIPVTKEFPGLKSDGEILIDSFTNALTARQRSWQDSSADYPKCLQEIQELKSLALEKSLHGISLSELSLAFLFPNSQKRLLPMMQNKLIDIYGRSPDLARSIVDLSIIGGHGSRSGALVDVLQHGLRPTEYQKQQHLWSFTGTHEWDGNSFNYQKVSFAAWVNDKNLMEYSRPHAINLQNLKGWMKSYRKEINLPIIEPTYKLMLERAKQMHDFLHKSDKTEKELDIEACMLEDFPILFLIENDAASRSNANLVDSDIGYEFSIKGGVSPENIPLILTPKANIETVMKMGNKYGWHGQIMDIHGYTEEK